MDSTLRVARRYGDYRVGAAVSPLAGALNGVRLALMTSYWQLGQVSSTVDGAVARGSCGVLLIHLDPADVPGVE